MKSLSAGRWALATSQSESDAASDIRTFFEVGSTPALVSFAPGQVGVCVGTSRASNT
jgi:hypothetical protein